MDQRRLFLAIAISLGIIVVFQALFPPPHRAPPPAALTSTGSPQKPAAVAPETRIPSDAGLAQVSPPREVPRVPLSGTRVQGSVSLLGARLDDLVLRDYRKTLLPDSPLVRVLEPRGEPQPTYVQYGWTADAGVRVPDNDTVWRASGARLSSSEPLALTWDNGAGLLFRIDLSLDDNYLFTARQSVRNTGGTAVALSAWQRVRRDYTPASSSDKEELLGMLGGVLKEVSYSDAKAKPSGEPALSATSQGGWAGLTDKYWLTVLVPDQARPAVATFDHTLSPGPGGVQTDGYQIAWRAPENAVLAPGGEVIVASRLFSGAKEVHLLDRYEAQEGIPKLWTAVDFGWFWFITRPFFYAIDWLYRTIGNFGLAIMAFTLVVKTAFFPLVNSSFRSMSKMKLLAPKMTALREQYKDEPSKLQSAMMALYREEKVNPVSGCLPMLLQIPVFLALYKALYVTIEMRHAPFFGWIRDLSAPDPTNVFNLFGLLPFDPGSYLPLLHLGIWPLILGATMYFQQRLNPPPPDPMQARLFRFMPLVFMFFMANLPAGLVIYYSWNNLLTIGQQWLIMRRTHLNKPSLART